MKDYLTLNHKGTQLYLLRFLLEFKVPRWIYVTLYRGYGGVVVSTPASQHNHPGSIPGSGMCSVDMGVLTLV